MDTVAGAHPGLHRLEAIEDVGAVRRHVRDLAVRMCASAAECGRAELATTELGTNALRHARPPGYLLIQALAPPHGRGIEVLSVDRGPGIRDLAAVLNGSARQLEPRPNADGVAAYSLGCGLASVRRLASEFDIHTVVGQGTVVLARFFFEPPARSSAFRWGAVSVPVPGELVNGDAWAISAHPSHCTALLVDGLGHGPCAAQAAEAAVGVFHAEPDWDIESYLCDAHGALRATRGAAASVAGIFADENRLLFAGVGNVEGRLHRAGDSVGLVPRNGTLGMNLQAPKTQLRALAWEPGATLVLYSDGIRSHFELDGLRDLLRRDPTVIAAVLHRDFNRGRDDATVVVVQDTRAGT